MIRVAHVLPSMAVGGRERIVADLCRTAPAHGVEPLVITYDRAEGATVALGAPAVTLDRRDAGFPAAVRAALAAERIDLIHAHGHIPAALLPRLDMPLVTTLHVALGGGWRWLPTIARGLRRSAAITAVSHDLARRFRWTGRDVAVIAPGLDCERFTRNERPVASPFTIGVAARLHPVKRHRDLLAALRLLASRGRPCRLLIAGEGPEREAIAAASAGLDVTLLGAVDDIPAFLRGLDAFVLPSDHEGTPLALMEAMAASLPIVATAVGGMPALVGDAGLLIPRRSPTALANAIGCLAGSADLRHRMGGAARARVRGHDLDAQAGAYRGLYATALARPPTSSPGAAPPSAPDSVSRVFGS